MPKDILKLDENGRQHFHEVIARVNYRFIEIESE